MHNELEAALNRQSEAFFHLSGVIFFNCLHFQFQMTLVFSVLISLGDKCRRQEVVSITASINLTLQKL